MAARFSSSKGAIMNGSFVECLETRRLLSAVGIPMASLGSDSSGAAPSLTTARTMLMGTPINAEANQAFRAVIGTIRSSRPLPAGYSLDGAIDWGDGSATSSAGFVRQADGSIAVIGEHTYATVGAKAIKVVVTAVPPAGSDAPTYFIGTFSSKANVIASEGGVTLEETAGQSFTATVGFFSSNLSSTTMTAVIQWGDGTQSRGKIMALPTVGPVPRFAVVGNHTYADTGSYIARVTVYAPSQPTVGPTTSPTATSSVSLVAQIESVIEVLPPRPTPTTA
jgi:hypothetical protein